MKELTFFPVFETYKTSLGPTKPPFLPVSMFFAEGVMLATDLHIAPRLRMSGAIHLLPQYAFLTWTGAVLYLLPWLHRSSHATRLE